MKWLSAQLIRFMKSELNGTTEAERMLQINPLYLIKEVRETVSVSLLQLMLEVRTIAENTQ